MVHDKFAGYKQAKIQFEYMSEFSDEHRGFESGFALKLIETNVGTGEEIIRRVWTRNSLAQIEAAEAGVTWSENMTEEDLAEIKKFRKQKKLAAKKAEQKRYEPDSDSDDSSAAPKKRKPAAKKPAAKKAKKKDDSDDDFDSDDDSDEPRPKKKPARKPVAKKQSTADSDSDASDDEVVAKKKKTTKKPAAKANAPAKSGGAKKQTKTAAIRAHLDADGLFMKNANTFEFMGKSYRSIKAILKDYPEYETTLDDN